MIERPSNLAYKSIDDFITDFINTPIEKLHRDIYSLALNIFSETNDWMKKYHQDLPKIFKKITMVESANDDVLKKKINLIFSKIVSIFSPEILQKNLDDGDLLKRFAAYRYGRINNLSLQEGVKDFFVAKELGIKDVEFEILTFLLLRDLKDFPPSGEENEQALIALLVESKQKGVSVESGFRKRDIHLEDSSLAEAWECLAKLNAYTPCQRLSLKGKIDRKCFSSFIQSNSLVKLVISDSSLDDSYFEEISGHLRLQALVLTNGVMTKITQSVANAFYINGYKRLKNIEVPSATKVYCNSCPALKMLSARDATSIICMECNALVSLFAPRAIDVECLDCDSLQDLDLPEALSVSSINCKSLGSLVFYKAKNVSFHNCPTLTQLRCPEATTVFCQGCGDLETIAFPLAKRVNLIDCSAIKSISLPMAVDVVCTNNPCLLSLILLHAEVVECSQCDSLITLTVPEATFVDCSGSLSLTVLEAPKARTVNCSGCTSLLTLTLPEATSADCSFCSSLADIMLPKATNAEFGHCDSLVTLCVDSLQVLECQTLPKLTHLSASNARQVFILGTSLATLDFPMAVKVGCIECLLLSALSCPQAVSVGCDGSVNLSTLHAPKLSLLSCAGVRSFEDLQIPEIVEILPAEIIPHLCLSAGQRAFQERLALYAMHPGILVPESEVPPVPHLDVDFATRDLAAHLDLESLEKKLISLILNIEMGDPAAPYRATDEDIQNGGKLYSKQDLRTGIGKLVESRCDEKEIQRLLFKIWQNESSPLHYTSKSLRSSAFIRLAVAAIEEDGKEEKVENVLHLLYRLEQLLSFFDSLNFDRPREAGYICPTRIKGDRGASLTAMEIKANLVRLFDCVKNRKACLGSPPSEDRTGLQLYYQTLGQYLQWIAINLENSNNEDRGMPLIDLGVAAGACASRWLGDVEQIYRLNAPQSRPLAIADLIHIQDGQFKLGILEGMSKNSAGKIDVHAYQQYKKWLIQEGIPIPGSKNLIGITDSSTAIPLNETNTGAFLFEYRPVKVLLMLRNYLASLFTDFKNRDLFLEFLKEMRPANWGGEEALMLDLETRLSRQEIREMLKEKGFLIRPDWNAAIALKNYADQNIQWDPQGWEKLQAEIMKLPVEGQKKRLQQEGIPLGPDDPDFSAEIILNYINPKYLDSLLEKDSNGEPTYMLTWSAMFDILERVGKFKKSNIPAPIQKSL